MIRRIMFALALMFCACASGPRAIPVEFVGGQPDEKTPQACKVEGKGDALKCEPLIPLLMMLMGGGQQHGSQAHGGPTEM